MPYMSYIYMKLGQARLLDLIIKPVLYIKIITI